MLRCWFEDGARKRISEIREIEVYEPKVLKRKQRVEYRARWKTTLEFKDVPDGSEVAYFAVGAPAEMPKGWPTVARSRVDAGTAHGKVFAEFKRGHAVVAYL